MFMNNQATCLICRLNICQSILKSFKNLRSLTVRMSEQMILLNELICKILDFGLRASVTPSTLLGTGHTGNRSDPEHSVRRSGSVRSDAMEHGSDRTRHRSDVSGSSRRDSITRRQSISLRHTDPGELLQLR